MVILSWIIFLALLGPVLGTLGHSFNFSEPQVFYVWWRLFTSEEIGWLIELGKIMCGKT